MLNVIIVLNDKEKSFDVKWVMNKEDILVVGKDYCPCCYYRLNNNKNKVKKLIGNLFSEAVIDGVSIKKVHEYYRLFLMDELDVNIVVSKEIIDENIPLKGIILKDKHVIVEEVSDEYLEEKNKEILDEIKKAFSGIPKDEINDSVAFTKANEYFNKLGNVFKSDEVKDSKPINLEEMLEAFDILNSTVDGISKILNVAKSIKSKLEDGTLNKDETWSKNIEVPNNTNLGTHAHPDTEVGYTNVWTQSNKESSLVSETIMGRTINFIKDNKSDVENLFEEVFKKPLYTPEEKAAFDTKEKLVNEMDMMFKIMTSKVNFTRKDLYNEDGTRRSVEEVYQITQDKLKDKILKGDENSTKEESDELKKVINFMLSPDPRFEALKKVNEYFAKLTEAIGKPDEVKISKPVKDEQEKSVDNKSVLSKISKTATYNLTNKDNRLILTLGKKIFMFNNIHVYYREGDNVKIAYLKIDQNGNFSSNLSFANFENLLKNNVFYHIDNLEQIKFLKDLFPSMPGMMEDRPDIVLYKGGEGFPVGFPDLESLDNYNNETVYQMVTNFYTFLPVSQFKELTVKKGMEKRTEELVDTKHNENKETGKFGESLNLRDIYVDINTESDDTSYGIPLSFSTLLPIKDKLFFTVDKSSDNGIGCLELLDREFLKISSLENNPLINNYYLTKEVCNSFVESGCGFTESNFLPIKKDENILYVKVHNGKLISTVTPQVANKFYMISYEQSPDEIMKMRKYFRSINVINNLSTLSHKEIDTSKFLITKSALAILSKSEEWSHIKFEEYKYISYYSIYML